MTEETELSWQPDPVILLHEGHVDSTFLGPGHQDSLDEELALRRVRDPMGFAGVSTKPTARRPRKSPRKRGHRKSKRNRKRNV